MLGWRVRPAFLITRLDGRRQRYRDRKYRVLTHLNATPKIPERTVVIGAGGFVGGAIVANLEDSEAEVLSVTRREVDLLASGAAEKLKALLRPDDAVVAVAACAPCKDMTMLIDNMAMVKAMLDAITTLRSRMSSISARMPFIPMCRCRFRRLRRRRRARCMGPCISRARLRSRAR